jgi:hypothetical protein
VVLDPREALPWPVLLSAPPPPGPDEHAYDQALALAAIPAGGSAGELTLALELFRRELDATILTPG